MHRNAPVVTSVCRLSVCIRHPGKMAQWIGTRLGMVVVVGLCIGVLDFGGDRRRGRDRGRCSFGRGGSLGLSIVTSGIVCVRATRATTRGSSQITLGFWPTILLVEPLVQCVVCLSVVCNVLYCGETVRLASKKLSEGVNRKPGSKS